ncbi:unnamed protein product [Mucor hiemalis]
MSNTKRKLAEYSWLKANYDHFDHMLFFEAFDAYSKNRSVSRFLILVNNWIDDTTRRDVLLQNFMTWKKSKEAKLYWKARATRLAQSAQANPCISTPSTSTASTTTSRSSRLSVVSNAAEELSDFFDANLTLPSVSA